jgi:hypothetical protein
MSKINIHGAPPAEPAKEKRIDIHDALLYAGVTLIVAGVAWLSIPCGVIVLGIALVALAFASA